MGVAPIGAVPKALQRAGMTIDDVDVYELNEAFAAQGIPIAARWASATTSQPARRRHRPRASVRHDRRPDHDRAAQRPRDPGRLDRPRDHVRRPGQGEAVIVERLN